MKILLIGANGQLGWELQRTCPSDIDLLSCDYPKIDLLNDDSIIRCVNSTSPDLIINAAAYTAVDKAEYEKEAAFRINHEAVQSIALLAKERSIRVVHISTDYVFDGKNFKPWLPDDKPNPQSVYGSSKFKGEICINQILGDSALIIRTAWLYSSHGSNFVKTMLKLMNEKKSLNVIDDQIGTPTWANSLAKVIWTAIDNNLSGTFHWTDAGVASWYDFAVAIQEEAISIGLLDHSLSIHPVSSNTFPTKAKRPFYSVLDKISLWDTIETSSIHWRVQLRTMLKELYKKQEKI